VPLRSAKDFTQALSDGRSVVGHFRKVMGLASVAGWWTDLGMAAGSPLANYYASEPLKAAVLNAPGELNGIFHGAPVSPKELYLADMMICSPSSGMVGTHQLMDYVLYYPFIDGHSTDEQVMFNYPATPTAAALPRYLTGAGLRAYMFAQAPTVGAGTFTINYVNQAGATKTSPTNYCTTTGAGMGANVLAQPASAGGQGTYINLAEGDTGIRRLISVTFIAPNSGLMAIVLAAPLVSIVISEINTPVEVSMLMMRPGAPRIYDDAYLAFMSNTQASTATGILTGRLNFVWTQ